MRLGLSLEDEGLRALVHASRAELAPAVRPCGRACRITQRHAGVTFPLRAGASNIIQAA